ncbi:S-adenosyl-L-methionine-dependent methyltransferase [Aspergillus californicus]
MASPPIGAIVRTKVTAAALIGYFPVAAHFELFNILADFDKLVTGEDVLAAWKERVRGTDHAVPKDTLFAMGGLGLLDVPDDNTYIVNDATRFLATVPSALHGGINFSTEVLLSAALLMPKLKATDFEYPFRATETAHQYAYEMMGNEKYAKEHSYGIMAAEGRLDSFNTFMTGKFVQGPKIPARLQGLGYDLAAVLAEAGPATSTKIVDIGGGRGELLLDIKEAFPELKKEDLIVQEFNDSIGDLDGVTVVSWDYRENSPQPVQGALIYHLSHILHNLPDLDAVKLLQKIAVAMAPHSRVLVHELTKNMNSAFLHAAMMETMGGRERNEADWRQIAAIADLTVSSAACPEFGVGVIELRKM